MERKGSRDFKSIGFKICCALNALLSRVLLGVFVSRAPIRCDSLGAPSPAPLRSLEISLNDTRKCDFCVTCVMCYVLLGVMRKVIQTFAAAARGLSQAAAAAAASASASASASQWNNRDYVTLIPLTPLCGMSFVPATESPTLPRLCVLLVA